MISRRLIRIKLIQILYAYFTNDNSSLDKSDRELDKSIKKTYDLYFYFILLIIKVVDYTEERIEIARNKKLPTFSDLNPNTLFIENKVVAQLRNSRQYEQYIGVNKLSWHENPELVKKLYHKIIESDYYATYLNAGKSTYDSDKQLIIDIFTNELDDWDDLYQIIEEQSIYWNDDIEFVISMIIKTLEKFKSADTNPVLMELYKNDEDRLFGKVLLQKTILKHKQYRDIIDHYTKNWEVERIALMDILIMIVALTEIMEFPSIPVKVTLNEYIDIARFYSTEKSNEFVNGILDKIVSDFRKENKIIKTGRGLLGET